MAKKIKLTNKNDIFSGSNAANQIYGLGGNDTIKGNGGNDTLVGGKGADILSGGKGADRYVFGTIADSKALATGLFDAKSGDTIKDFTSVKDSDKVALQDKIDLSALSKSQALTWSNITATKFGVWHEADAVAKKTTVYVDTTGDGIADMSLKINTLEVLTEEDFIGVKPGDKTAPAAPIVALTADTGTSTTDNITNNAALNVTGIEAGASVEYSTDGSTWGAAFTTVQGFNTVLVRQRDAAGNASAFTIKSFILDSIAPSAPSVALTSDTGIAGDKITSNGALSVTGVEANAIVEYSINGGTVWSNTFGTFVGLNTVQVRQIDAAGNASAASAAFTFTLYRIDLATLSTGQGFKIQGAAAGDWAGLSVSSAGDINGDGFDDLIVGAPYADKAGNNTDEGAAYVVFGKSSGFGTIDLSTNLVTSGLGFKIQGALVNDYAGNSVSSAGDVNGDGFDDLIVGVPFGDGTTGAAYVIYGGAFGKGTTPVVTTGTTIAPEMLIGGAGNDILTGNGGADIFRGGAGNDILGVTGRIVAGLPIADFKDIDGGNGYDTIRMDGIGDEFNFNTILLAKIHSIEAFDLRATGNQTIRLNHLDVFDLSDDTTNGLTTLTISGTTGDTVDVTDDPGTTGWTKGGTSTIGADIFDIWSNGNARLVIDTDILVM